MYLPAPAPAWGLLQSNDVILTINDNLARTISAAAIIELVLTSTSLRLGVAKRRAKQRTHPPLPPHIDDDDDDGRGSRVAGTGVQLRKPSSTDEAMPPYRPPFLVEGEADGSAAEDADLESSQLDRTVFFNEDVSHQQSPAPLAIITLKWAKQFGGFGFGQQICFSVTRHESGLREFPDDGVHSRRVAYPSSMYADVRDIDDAIAFFRPS